MTRFIFIFLWTILSIGELKTIGKEEYIWQLNNDGILPIEEEHGGLVQEYQNFNRNNVVTEQRNSPTNSCVKHNRSQNIQPEDPTVPLPSRRSSGSQRNPYYISNEQPQVPIFDNSNKIKSVNYEERLQNQQSFYNEDRLAEPQNSEQEKSITLKPDPVEDNVIENMPRLHETPPLVNELRSNHNIVATLLESDESESSDFEVSEELTSATPANTESSILSTVDECTDKNEINSLVEPPKRYLSPRNYNLPSPQKNILNRNSGVRKKNNKLVTSNINNNLRTYNNNAGHQLDSRNGDASNLNDETVAKTRVLHNNKDPQQINENPAGRSGSGFYTIGKDYTKLKDPTKGEGISYINKNARMKLMDFERVCYACSSANNPTCLSPDRKTTVKFCRKGLNACVTKIFGTGNTLTLIRDCGKTCDDAEIPGLVPKYKSCSICHSDLCNGSYSINVYSSMLTLPTIALIVLVKPFLFIS